MRLMELRVNLCTIEIHFVSSNSLFLSLINILPLEERHVVSS